jgi:Spy/CpxP family protein refolding chaperone
MKRGNLPIALYLLLVFISGAVVGALGYRAYKPPVASSNAPSPEEARRQYLHEMETRAKMSPEQIQKLSVIMDETRARFHASREQHNLEVKQIGEQQRAKVRAILTADQLPKVEQLWKERDERAKQQQNPR